MNICAIINSIRYENVADFEVKVFNDRTGEIIECPSAKVLCDELMFSKVEHYSLKGNVTKHTFGNGALVVHIK